MPDYEVNSDLTVQHRSPEQTIRQEIKERLRLEEAERVIAEKREWLEGIVRSYGDDVYDEYTAVRWRKKFTQEGREYVYAAIKANGLWHVTGQRGESLSWTDLILSIVCDGKYPTETIEVLDRKFTLPGQSTTKPRPNVFTLEDKAESSGNLPA